MSRGVVCFVIAILFGFMGLTDLFPPYRFFNLGFIVMMGLGVITFILELKFNTIGNP